MRAVAIVQARTGSTRLPGKVLRPLAGRPVLEWVVARLRRARRVEEVWIATTRSARDAPVAELARRLGVEVTRGSEEDVLGRFAQAARESAAETVVRITADCPLADGALVDEMLARFEATGPWDYYANVVRRTYPRGLDVEIAPAGALFVADAEARAPHDREHVMPFLYQRPERFRIGSHELPEDLSAHRWVLDTAEDLRLLEELFAELGADAEGASWRDALAAVRRRPELSAINAGVPQKTLPERGDPRA